MRSSNADKTDSAAAPDVNIQRPAKAGSMQPTLYDPQTLTPWQTAKWIVTLGRIPLASEVPLWTAFGCVLAARLFHAEPAAPSLADAAAGSARFRLLAGFAHVDFGLVLQCMFITWATNVSINYGNEYFDWDMDHPGQVAAIARALEVRRRAAAGDVAAADAARRERFMARGTRLIHDGSFPPYVALVVAAAWQAAVVGVILASRAVHGAHSPFRGVVLPLWAVCTLASQGYVGPPLRLHYHGWGEIVSALFLSPVSALFGMLAYYTATSGRAVSFADLARTSAPLAPAAHGASGFALSGQLWTLLGALYFAEQARIWIMHIVDIDADRAGNKITLVVRVGQRWASRLYVICNVVALALYGRFVYGLPGVLGESRPHAFARAITAGITLVLTYAVPIMVVTTRSLFAAMGSAPASSSSKSVVPTLPLNALPPMVSIQCLSSAVVLAVTLLVCW